MSKPSATETEHKRAWLNRYRESLAEQRRIAEQLEEARDLSSYICVSLNPGRSSPTGTHSDRVADSVQRITALEKKLSEEQQRGFDIYTEIIDAAYNQLSSLPYIKVLLCQYIDGLTVPETAKKTGLSKGTVAHYRRAAFDTLAIPESTKCVK